MIQGRHFFNLIIVGFLTYLVIHYWQLHPDWYKNKHVTILFTILRIGWLFPNIVTTILFIVLAFRGEYRYEMNNFFVKRDNFFILLFFIATITMVYESICRIFDKYLTINNER